MWGEAQPFFRTADALQQMDPHIPISTANSKMASSRTLYPIGRSEEPKNREKSRALLVA